MRLFSETGPKSCFGLFQVLSLQQELKARNANWEVVTYSDTLHGFTVPGANYNAQSDKRSWEVMKNFFEEIYKK